MTSNQQDTAGYRIVPRSVRVREVDATLFEIGFTRKLMTNDLLVREVTDALTAVKAQKLGGRLALLNGPASLPVCAAIIHQIAHLFGAVALWDPKMDAYVVAIAHDPEFTVGQTIRASEVVATDAPRNVS